MPLAESDSYPLGLRSNVTGFLSSRNPTNAECLSWLSRVQSVKEISDEFVSPTARPGSDRQVYLIRSVNRIHMHRLTVSRIHIGSLEPFTNLHSKMNGPEIVGPNE